MYNSIFTTQTEVPAAASTVATFPQAQLTPLMFTAEWTDQMNYDWHVADLTAVWVSGFFSQLTWSELWANKVKADPALTSFPEPAQPGEEVFTPFLDQMAALDYIDNCYG